MELRRSLSSTFVLTAALFALAPACSKKVPDDVAPTLDAIRVDARAVADSAAKACAADFVSGRFTITGTTCATNKLPGEEVVKTTPSPAKGTSLETNPNVANVFVTCYAPLPSPTRNSSTACGSSLGSLRTGGVGPMPVSGRTRNSASGNCKTTSTDCEEVVVPSQYAPATATADLRIVKPVTGGPPGATAEITIVLAKK